MNKSGIAAVCVALMATMAPATYGRTDAPGMRSCAPRIGVTLVASNAHAQLYERPSSERRAGLYGCLRRGGTAVYLGEGTSYEGTDCPRKEVGRCVRISDQMLAGTTVAYLATPSGLGYSQDTSVATRSLVTGRVLHRAEIYVRTVHRTLLEFAEVLALRAKPDGAIAWIQYDSYGTHGGLPTPPPAYSVFAIDGNGFHTLTPELPSAPSALALSGSLLSWTNEANRESTILD